MPDPSLMIAVADKPEMKSKGGKPCVILPGGFSPEDGKMPGDKIQALVEMTLSDKPGEAYLDSVDGAKYSDTEKETPPEDAAEPAEEPPSQPAPPPMSFRDKAMAMNS